MVPSIPAKHAAKGEIRRRADSGGTSGCTLALGPSGAKGNLHARTGSSLKGLNFAK